MILIISVRIFYIDYQVVLTPVFFVRLRSNHTCWIIKCAMNVKAPAVVENLHRFSALMSLVCNTIVNSVGCKFIVARAVSSTNPSSRRALRDRVQHSIVGRGSS